MSNAQSLADQFRNSANEFWTSVGSYLPKVLGALILIAVAIVVAKLAQSIVEKVLDFLGVNKLAKNKQVAKTLKMAEVNIDVTSIAGRTVFWVIIIIFALTIADVLGLSAMRDVIQKLVEYLPKVLAGAIVLTVTVAGARLVRDVIAASLTRMHVDYAGTVSTVAFYVLVIFGSLMTLDQLGFNTTILSNNITILVAGFTFALALAFGLGGRDVASRILENVYGNLNTTKKK